MSSGPGSSGKPWPRLMALLSRAACDIASKTVTGRSANTLLKETMVPSAARPGRLARGLPADDAAGEMLVVGQACGLGGERGRHRSLARTAGEHDLLAPGIGDRLGIEARQRHDHTNRIGLHRD